ncbi:exopolysaccharide biosynthesis protein [Pseudooceanicola onchidii]|uniref:exopolysaccharide biosynthesis protein n=1 Tax=Pseudooceanicola onchidii TaxID=2562279 RepID=UPI0010AA1E77|nr:exopolysaccharide biosynthesis protein [Pseudooceanicola onchidii]
MTQPPTPHRLGPPESIRSLSDILDALDDAGTGDTVTIREILEEIGVRSFAPMILVPALILVSPLSGIFGLPTIGATFMLLVTLQKLLGRRHVWLPEFLKRRKIATHRLKKAVSWLRKPCRWIDNRTHKRLTMLVSRPANIATLLTIVAICSVIPFLEVLPMVTSIFAGAISMFSIGLLARDGLFIVLGYAQTAASATLVLWLLTTAAGG